MDFTGEKHPENCPCQKQQEKERLDRERLDRRKAEEEEKKIQAEQEEKRLENQKRMDRQIEMKKRQHYRKMNGSGSGSSYKQGGSEFSGKSASTLDPSGTDTCPEILNIDTKIMSEYFCQSVIIPPLPPLDNFILITGTKIKAAEELKKRTSRVIDHFPELRSGRSSLVIIDGEMKSLTSEFIEQVDENTKLLGVLILVMDL